jgi:hypothetical protein
MSEIQQLEQNKNNIDSCGRPKKNEDNGQDHNESQEQGKIENKEDIQQQKQQ